MPECAVCGLVTSSSSCPVCGSQTSDAPQRVEKSHFEESREADRLPFGLDGGGGKEAHSSIPFGLELSPEESENTKLAFGLENSPDPEVKEDEKIEISEQSANQIPYDLSDSPSDD